MWSRGWGGVVVVGGERWWFEGSGEDVGDKRSGGCGIVAVVET